MAIPGTHPAGRPARDGTTKDTKDTKDTKTSPSSLGILNRKGAETHRPLLLVLCVSAPLRLNLST
jgi:hypothetical protein